MTEKIQHIIDSIRLKCKSLYTQLETERTKTVELSAEIHSLKNDISILNERNSEIQIENERLNSELNSIKQQRIDENLIGIENRNEEIDDLVREIEHCINQLKK
jgi:hypothetical protein